MDWTIVAVGGAAVVGFIALKRMSFVSEAVACEHLRGGALVIDVRSAGEFGREHLPQAINIPLGDIAEVIPQRVKDKNQALLLHCLSGGRSGFAKRQLKTMGYTRVFNLGSYSRAKLIVNNARKD